MNNANIDKIMISNKVSFRKKGIKYFIGYQYDGKIRPLCILIPKTSGYKKSFHKTNYVSVLTEDEKLLKASNKVWDQMINIMEKNLIANQLILKNISK